MADELQFISMNADPDAPMRQRMVDEQIRGRGIADARVLAAMQEIPREKFVPVGLTAEAFDDRALAIDCGQTISQPYMVAAMTALLDLQLHHRVLEIGTGSGYQTAVLARLAGQVYTIERIEPLQSAARALLDSLGFNNIAYRVADGSAGWPEEAPFDRIMVTAGAPEIPPALVAQLVDQGRLVVPVGQERDQILTVVERDGPRIKETPRFPCRFVKLIGEQAWQM
jgi:protein-L-isoaspartate(D-aspartate) O-methyltransferase